MRLLEERKRRGRRGLRLNRTVFLALAAAVLAIGVANLSRPLATIRSQNQQLTQLRQRQRALLEQRRLLEAEKRRLATEEGQEWAARRRGYLRPGERRLVFSPEDESQPDDPALDPNAREAPELQ
jgi:cell division protein FtsB